MANFQEELQEIEEIAEVADLDRRGPIFRDRMDPSTFYKDDEFRRRYRLSKESAQYIINLVRQDLEAEKHGPHNITVELQVLLCLRFYAKGSYQVETGDVHGVSQPSVSRIVKKVSLAIASLLPQFIRYPENLGEVQGEFYEIAQFLSVIGALDCTHVKIKNPSKDEAMLYMNRKGFYSLNVQVVCDAQCKILDIVANWRGSAHDSRLWNECGLREEFENGTKRGILLGDGGYPCGRYLLTPLLNPVTPQEQSYNRAHILTRNTIESCFGQWKSMFRALQNGLQISLDTEKIAITAMAVLYNIRKIRGENEDYKDEPEDDSSEEEEIEVPQENVNVGADGNLFRRMFIQQHFHF